MRSREQARCALGAVSQAGGQVKADMMPSADATHRVFGRFACVLLTEGSGRFEDGRGYACTLAAGDLWLVFLDVGHRYGPCPGGTWRETYLVFEGPVFDRGYADGLIRAEQPVYRTSAPERWATRWSRFAAYSNCSPT